MKTAKTSNNRPTFTIACEPEKNVNEITNVDFGQNPKKNLEQEALEEKGKASPATRWSVVKAETGGRK